MLSVERIERIGESVILYDASLINHMREAWFDPGTWAGSPRVPGNAGGRGATLFIECEGEDWVLRHYHRGGMVARVVRDSFVWLGEARTRSFAEWRLLARLQDAGLPAPRPVAVRYRRRGLLYTADLITVRIPDVVPLSTRMARGRLAPAIWGRVGACVGRFHAAGVCHADLNAHNLQINSADDIFLLDFDRGCLRSGGGWRRRNLQRLNRSLHKVSNGVAGGFAAADWAALVDGYRAHQPLA